MVQSKLMGRSSHDRPLNHACQKPQLNRFTSIVDRWEYSHIARAVFSAIALIALAVAIAI
jgi:hypothetical protein